MRCHTAKSLALLLAAIIGCLLCACSNSEGVDCANHAEEIAAVNEVSSDSNIPKVQETSFSSKELNYLPLDDSEYPYAGIPRIVIETENFRQIRDRETEIPAKMQLWSESSPISDVINLTIKGRGNSSWIYMPKKSYKIELTKKQELLNMPQNRDWALISNYADKTLMKNYLVYHLSSKLNAFYSPRCEFIELFLNNDYLGVYLLTETIKIGKNRINIPKNDNSYIIEKTQSYQEDDQLIYSQTSKEDSNGVRFKVHYPQNATIEILTTIREHIEKFEKHLMKNTKEQDNLMDQWININEYTKYYWVQEFSKNPDAATYSSIFFSWIKGGTITMGPVWDFDIAFGSYSKESINQPDGWLIKKGYWHHNILKDSVVANATLNFWRENKHILFETINVADSMFSILNKAASNNFRRWNILQSTKYIYHRHSYSSYKEAVDDLKKWILNRYEWLDKELQ